MLIRKVNHTGRHGFYGRTSACRVLFELSSSLRPSAAFTGTAITSIVYKAVSTVYVRTFYTVDWEALESSSPVLQTNGCNFGLGPRSSVGIQLLQAIRSWIVEEHVVWSPCGVEVWKTRRIHLAGGFHSCCLMRTAIHGTPTRYHHHFVKRKLRLTSNFLQANRMGIVLNSREPDMGCCLP